MHSDTEKKTGLQKYDASDFLTSPEDCAAYLQEYMNDDEDDEVLFLKAVGNVLKAQRKMTLVSKELGVSREGLYKSLSEKGNPSFQTIVKVLKSLGLGLSVHPIEENEEATT